MCRPRAALEPFVLLLAPYAPHLAEELWQLFGHPDSLTYAPWPQHDEALLVVESIKLPVQVGRLPAASEMAIAIATTRALVHCKLHPFCFT